ncbi:mechanosensitive ion channel family protein [Candidatus Saccharibacteria bacterium]|nr:mechanosensitive ion channel family protein [Candidatus Saccharibacteria bacterium]
MDFIEELIKNTWIQRLFWSIIIVILNLLIYRIVSKVLNDREKKSSKIMNGKKNKTLIRLLKSIAASTLGIITILTVLQIYGVNVTSMLAGVGVAGIVIGFALQDSLKDIVRGFVIVSDNYFEIGDVIKYGNNIGPVVSVSLLTTKIQDINTMNYVSIANRNIDQVEVDPGYLYIPIPLPYELKISKAEDVMQEIIEKLHHKKNIKTAAYQGISQIDTSSLNYQIVVTCDPTSKLQTRRDCLHVIMEVLEEHKIQVPYTQLDLHNKK